MKRLLSYCHVRKTVAIKPEPDPNQKTSLQSFGILPGDKQPVMQLSIHA